MTVAFSAHTSGIVAHRHDQVAEPVCEHLRPVLKGTEMRVHPSDPVGAYSWGDFLTYMKGQYPVGDYQGALQTATSEWNKADSALASWVPVPFSEVLSFRSRGVVNLCTSPRELVQEMKPWLPFSIQSLQGSLLNEDRQ